MTTLRNIRCACCDTWHVIDADELKFLPMGIAWACWVCRERHTADAARLQSLISLAYPAWSSVIGPHSVVEGVL